MKNIGILIILLFSIPAMWAQDSSQTFLSVKGTGVEEFINSHPEYDGRGTIIFVLDTGVDMGIDGLEKTSTGDVKVIDVQDFSGEGDIKLYDCDVEEDNDKYYFINEDRDLKVSGAHKLQLKPVDGKYYIGALDETKLKNSGSKAEDLNGNGSTTDKYTVVSFKTIDGSDTCWVAYFDVNSNGDLSDDKPLRNYKEKFDTFKIKNEKGLPQLTFAVNIFPGQKKISLFFDDGGHGTHVSGIAAGYHIGGSYLNGVAPGAKIIGLKIGNNNYSGGATVTGSMRNAFLYADKVSKEKKEPCVLNMSFGIGSEIEARSEMELFLDSLLYANPYLYVCLSNGNDGPGISTAGLPSSCGYALSSGAVLPYEVGRDLFGSTLKQNVMFFFSSRGGEVSKPDICSPGVCTSTVPNWEPRDVMGGTSMASPYTAGVVSVILSALEKENPDIKVPSQLLFKAIKESAVKMEGYSALDQGTGYINVINAYSVIKKYIAAGEINKFETYTISSFSPNMPDGKAPNLYIRNGNYLTGEERYTYTVKRNDFQKKDKFYRIYNIKSNTDWLLPIQKKTYIRNKQHANITVMLDKKKLTEPGLYVGRITATRDDKSNMPEFNMLATVVIPYRFCREENFSREWDNETVEPGLIKRYFIEMPAGQTAMHVSISPVKGKYVKSRFWLFDPDGVDLYTSRTLNTQGDESGIENEFYNLRPGVYELDVEGSFMADGLSEYNLSVGFTGVNRIGDAPLDSVNKSIEVINSYNGESSYNISGKILGYENSATVKISGPEHYSLPFTMSKDESYKVFTVNLSKEDFNKMTDFSVIVYNKKGKAVNKDGLSYKEGKLIIDKSSGADTDSLTLELIPAFSNENDSIEVNLKEATYLKTAKTISVSDNGKYSTVLYPSISRSLQCSCKKPGVTLPAGSRFFGKIYFESELSKKIEAELPIYLNF